MRRNKFLTALVCGLLLLGLSASFLIPALAADNEKPVLSISSMEEFEVFRENCRLDSYSRGLTVSLETNLDFTDLEFSSIPIFNGTFLGNSHTLRGITFTGLGSNLGLFRYLGEGAQVQDLNLEASITPEGSLRNIGSYAGSNAGTIHNCRFIGEVSGKDCVGGIAGVNQVTGIIENCRVLGNVHGDHFIGGVAGQNYGVIRDCANRATVNTSSQENTVELTSITIETITGTESANTVTDVGGIVGANIGVTRDCVNRGTVGYRHMAYNVGGIAGSQRGYLSACTNYGEVYGRKEVGGIVGQVEPVAKIEYTIDALQILKGQLNSASAMLGQAASNAQQSAGSISGNLQSMKDEGESARDAISVLFPKPGEEAPDPDSIVAAENTLNSSIHNMGTIMNNVSASAQDAAGQLSADLRAVSGQIHAMGQTISDAENHLGGRVSDVSDEDTPEEVNGKVDACQNFGSVDGDINVGGIAGAMAFENDMDPESDLQFSGDPSLNFDSEVRAVILNCTNRGAVSAKKNGVGGIVGWMSLGLTRGCVNTGVFAAKNADYVGGIAGSSSGYIRSCSSKSLLSGSTHIGGIAGSATTVTDCLSMVYIMEGEETMGAILGQVEEPKDFEEEEEGPREPPVARNYYLSFSHLDPGGIDGISYDGIAQPMALLAFLSQENLPDAFRNATVRFFFEDGRTKSVTIPIGTALKRTSIPKVPAKRGFDGTWTGLDKTDTDHVYFDMNFYTEYTPHRMTIASTQMRRGNMPILLAEGKFPTMDHIAMAPAKDLPVPGRGTAIEGWEIPVFRHDAPTVLHYAYSPNLEPDRLRMYVRRGDGSWEETATEVNGSYLVFTVQADDTAICLTRLPSNRWLRYTLLGAGAVGLLILVTVLRTVRKKKE